MTAVLRAAPLVAAVCLLRGCATVPKVDPSVGTPSAAQAPRIVGRAGPLSQAEVRRVVDGLAATNADDRLLRRHLAVEQAVAGGPLVEGETTRLLKDGAASFRAIFAAISNAKRRVDLEYYILEDVESDGVRFGDLLARKRAEGVEINLIYDDFGSKDTPKAFLDRLRATGVRLVTFNPLDPFKSRTAWKPNDRDHRKILVADGTTAIVGGVNLAKDYEIRSSVGSGAAADGDDRPWRDTDVEVRGPAVVQLERVFVAHWQAQRGPDLGEVADLPAVPGAKGNSVVRFIGSTPDQPLPRYYATLVSALRSSERSVVADAAYFAPTKDELNALLDAAGRGVDVTLILPDKSDSSLALAMGHSFYGQLLRAGVHVYEIHGVVLHSKTVTVDGVWSIVGSSNFDHRSVVFNDEVDAIVIGSETARELEAMAAEDKARATPVSMADWRRRSIVERGKETVAKVMENML